MTITPDVARTLPGLFAERVRRTPDAVAYRHAAGDAWVDTTWAQAAEEVACWRGALAGFGLARGDRVAIMLRNCREWAWFDLAALGLGMVVVPLYAHDRTENAAYILRHAGARLLLAESVEALRRDVERAVPLAEWPAADPVQAVADLDPDAVATIPYTSGTTGRPKGVALTHRNILSNTWASQQRVPIRPDDVFLSFLPLSHMFERTAGYYLPMLAGAAVAHVRSVSDLAADLAAVRPTALISVPRIYDRTYAAIREKLAARPVARALFRAGVAAGWSRFLRRQGRGPWRPSHLVAPLLQRVVGGPVQDAFGGRLRLAMTGGAPMQARVARALLGLGVPLLQGYGLTEASPVVTTNVPDDNDPASVGRALPGVELELGPDDELWVRGPGVMRGYWKDPAATARVVDEDGWLHTGDRARIEGGRVFITGRLKAIIVLANGEKVPPEDMELAILDDPLFEQAVVVGEARPFLAALVVLTAKVREGVRPADESEAVLLERIERRLADFPGYARIKRLAIVAEPWTIENGLLTPTLKPKREAIEKHLQPVVDRLYAETNR